MGINKEKKERIVLIFNTALFVLGAVDYFDKSTTLFIVLVVAALSNLSMIIFKGATKSHLNVFVFLLNSMIAFLVARDYYFSGSDYIHFAWLAAGIVYLVATISLFKRNKE